MRAVAFVEHVEFEFKGNLAKDAIALGDVDNDENCELAVGNLQGDLAVFKGCASYPYAEAHDLGMITSVVIGNVFNEGRNSLVTISGEGWCHIFDVKKSSLQEEEKKRLQPFHTQRLPANTKVALLADVDGDGAVELVLGLTDRVLRTYRWVKISQNSFEVKGKLVGLHKWEFANQVGSVSLNTTREGIPNILVAQPGGTYTKLECSVITSVGEETGCDSSILSKLTPEHKPLALSRMRNRDISSEIIGGISGLMNGHPTSSLIAVATLDGTLMLVDDDRILWSLQVDHQLFALTKLDLTGDGREEVIACAWDGQTYMVNQDKQSVRFQFDEPVCAFTSGYFTLNFGQTMPVLVYATFNDHIHLYYNVRLPTVRTYSLLEAMEQHPETANLLASFPVDVNNTQQLKDLYSWCLYGFPAKLETSVDPHLGSQ